MKCIKKSEKVMRVPEHVACEKIKQGWSFCSKSEFKKTADKEVIHRAEPVASDKPKKNKKQKKQRNDDTGFESSEKKD